MPGMGLTAIGLAGVTISYVGVAHTFVDGMHALTGLTLFLGLIFLSCGILEGGVSTSNKAKATTLVILAIALSFGAFAFTQTTITTLPTYAGLMLIITVPAIVIAYVAMKMPTYLKPVAGIFILAAGAGIIAFVTFGVYGPSPYLLAPEVEEAAEVPAEEAAPTEVFAISILVGSSEQGNPDYDPDVAKVAKGHVVQWTNDDSMQHTVTSSVDFGETFDSGLLNEGEKFLLDSGELAAGEYEYMCIVHPWMTSTLVIEEPKEAATVQVAIPIGAGIQQPGQQYYDPNLVTVSVGTTVVWANNDDAVHTVTAGNPTDGPSGVFDSDLISAGESFEYTFNTAGKFDYYCIVHPWMQGTVIAE